MDAMFEHDRGFYTEPNFSFEDTFCREITSCIEYEQDANANICQKEGIYRINEGSISSSLHRIGEALTQATSTSNKQCRLTELQTKRGDAQASEESSLADDNMMHNFSEMLGYDEGVCGENSEVSEQSPISTWGSDHEIDNRLGCARVRLEPMKRIRRLRANDRERRRMRSLNRALDSLKKCIPVPQSKRRVTKLEILRIACSYIRSLSDTLRGEPSGTSGPFRKRNRAETVVNGFSVAQRLEILSTSK